MRDTLDTKNIGLRGVKVADTRISDVDGEKGTLIYRGFNVVDLARFSTFEEVSFLLLHDRLPTQEELERFQSEMVREREVPEALLKCLKAMPNSSNPMDVLQASIPILASSAPVYHMIGIPIDLFTPVFAISRISGWSAHIIEEKFAEAQPKPELYRPDADYVGNYCGLRGCEYIPMEERFR